MDQPTFIFTLLNHGRHLFIQYDHHQSHFEGKMKKENEKAKAKRKKSGKPVKRKKNKQKANVGIKWP